MAAGSLLTLLDDIATLLDDIATMTRVAVGKTAGVLGDDLALNAEQVTGVASERELPVVLAVAKGSFINKIILVPLAVVLSKLAPWAVIPLLICGGLFLCYEGAEKVLHKVFGMGHGGETPAALAAPVQDPETWERDRIRGAIRTDLILSAEIIVITLGLVVDRSLAVQFGVLSAIGLLMVLVVYGLVAAIVKLDDVGLYLSQRQGGAAPVLGRFILRAAPVLMKTLGIVGTIAMFLVGGGILVHNLPFLHDAFVAFGAWVSALGGGLSGVLDALTSAGFNGLTGLAAGLILVALVTMVRRVRGAAG